MSKKKKSRSDLPDNNGLILVVEDSPATISLIRATLEEAGYYVLIATSGESALDRIRIQIPDLILLDVMLPGMDGYETCKKIKSEKKWAEIPVIFLSVLSDPEDKVIGFQAGAVDYLIKPYSAAELLARVDTHLKVSRLHNQVITYSRELEARLEELDTFTYLVSHDLRNPVRAIDGFAHLLSSSYATRQSEDFTHYLKKIHENVRIMDQLIEDLLRISRISRIPIEDKEIDMKNLAASVVQEIKKLYPSIPFTVIIDDIPPASGDPHLIKQVFVNLVSNAMRFSQSQKTPQITIGHELSGSIGEYYVKDNGIGFNMQYAEKIFEIFFTLPYSDDYEGTGAGLTIVKRIITKHGGKVRAISKEGSGSTFFFTLNEDSSDDLRFSALPG